MSDDVGSFLHKVAHVQLSAVCALCIADWLIWGCKVLVESASRWLRRFFSFLRHLAGPGGGLAQH